MVNHNKFQNYPHSSLCDQAIVPYESIFQIVTCPILNFLYILKFRKWSHMERQMRQKVHSNSTRNYDDDAAALHDDDNDDDGFGV